MYDRARRAIRMCSALCRSFAVRRIRDGFKANKSLVDPGEITAAYDKAVNSYELLQRQVRGYNYYILSHSVIMDYLVFYTKEYNINTIKFNSPFCCSRLLKLGMIT